jgi:hypothetical protein
MLTPFQERNYMLYAITNIRNICTCILKMRISLLDICIRIMFLSTRSTRLLSAIRILGNEHFGPSLGLYYGIF